MQRQFNNKNPIFNKKDYIIYLIYLCFNFNFKIMKYIISFLFFSISLVGFCQINSNTITLALGKNLTPNGLLDNVFDQYGNKYRLSDIKIQTVKKATLKVANPITTAPLICGYYKLFFETGCGFENDSDPVQNSINQSRRLVLKQVYEDLSAFINSPLTTSGNKVNIWIRNINNITTSSGVLGLATSFYNIPRSSSGTIVDGEIWKTIHLGSDSYVNSSYPQLYPTNNFNVFYHGMTAINFSNPTIIWNTDLNISSPIGLDDLYSVILHEVTHSLGFNSLINEIGRSKFGYSYEFYSRYDKFLKNNSINESLITNSGSCSMYWYSFNSSLSTDTLHPGCSTVNTGSTDPTSCNISGVLKYVGSNTVPIFTPSCFEPSSSLSHFEDTCFINPSTGTPYGNNLYFAMSNAIGSGISNTKRFLKPEERNVLSDLGYSVKSIYGTLGLLTYKDYATTASTGITVAGLNDGLDGNRFAYIADPGLPFTINGILANDVNATSFECLEDLTDYQSNLSVAGNIITFTSNLKGVHLLRYVPVNSILNQKGNITYIYVYVQEHDYNGNPSTDCNLVINGDFEQHSAALPTNQGQFNGIVSGWKTVLTDYDQSNDYYNTDSTTTNISLPCNSFGYETDRLGGRGYIGMYLNGPIISQPTFYVSETIKTKLRLPLLPNKDYILSFDLSLSDTNRAASKIQAYLSNQDLTVSLINNGIYDSNIPITDLNMLKSNPNYSVTKNGWERVTFIFHTGAIAGQQYLYLGGLNNNGTPNLVVSAASPSVPPTCIPSSSANNLPYYYLDNVELFPIMTVPTITGQTYACDIYNEMTTNSTTIVPGTTITWSITGGAGTIIGSNSQSSVDISWSSLPGIISLTVTTPEGCTTTTTQTIVKGCACDIMDANYFTASQVGNTVNNFQFFNSITGTFGGPVMCDYGDGTAPTSDPISHTYTTNGTYIIDMLFYAKQCSFHYYQTVVISTNIAKSSTSELSKSTKNTSLAIDNYDMFLYPNPTSSEININLDMEKEGEIDINILTLDSKIINTKKWKLKEGKQTITFKLPYNVKKGVVLIEIIKNGIKTVKKVVVE